MLSALLAGGLAPSFGAEAAKADVFDVIGMSPAEVVVALTERLYSEDAQQLSYGIIGLPISAGHLEEFIASLRTAITPARHGYLSARSCLLNLLEEDGRCDEALAVLKSGPHRTLDDGIQEVRLLWQTGKENAAGELAAQLVEARNGERLWHSPVWIDLIHNDIDHARRFLTFLGDRDTIPAQLRYGRPF